MPNQTPLPAGPTSFSMASKPSTQKLGEMLEKSINTDKVRVRLEKSCNITLPFSTLVKTAGVTVLEVSVLGTPDMALLLANRRLRPDPLVFRSIPLPLSLSVTKGGCSPCLMKGVPSGAPGRSKAETRR